MSKDLRGILLILMLAAGLALAPGCAEKGQPRPAGGQAKTLLADDVFRDPGLNIYWVSPRNWKPLKGGDDFLFGWQRPGRGGLAARCLVFGGTPTRWNWPGKSPKKRAGGSNGRRGVLDGKKRGPGRVPV